MSDTVKVPLATPIEAHGEILNEIELGDVMLGHLDGINIVVDGEKGDLRINLGDLHKLVAHMAGIPPSSAGQIRIKDMMAARQAIADFFGFSLPTGGSA